MVISFSDDFTKNSESLINTHLKKNETYINLFINNTYVPFLNTKHFERFKHHLITLTFNTK